MIAELTKIPAEFWRHRYLIGQLTRREIVGRYRGSVLGLLWSFFHPLTMLAVYTFVFGVVFQARWGGGGESRLEFALILFSGLIVFNLFAEVVNRAPSLVLGHANLVRKVVFPLEILPVVAAGSAFFHAVVSLAVLLLFQGGVHLSLPVTILFLPLLLLPLLLLTLGTAWILASLGVYLRDLAQAVGIFTTALLFLSPIFFPITALPVAYRPLLYLNPLSFIIDQTREVLIWGRMPDWRGLGAYAALSVLFGIGGLFAFRKLRQGFADVL